MRRALLLVSALSLFGFLTPGAQAAAAGVTIQNLTFNPSTVTVNAGEAVTFTNKDSFAHTATADDGSFDTSPTCDAAHTQDESCLKPNEPFSVTFQSPGTWTYHCKIHSNMHGTVIVNEGATTTTTEPPTSAPVVPSTTEAPTTTSASASSSATTTSSTTTTTSSTTTTTSSTTSTTTSTTLPSSGSGQVAIKDSGSGGGGSSAVPFLIGGAAAVAALAGIAYWLWWRSGAPYDDGPDWTQEPPPTAQGPRI